MVRRGIEGTVAAKRWTRATDLGSASGRRRHITRHVDARNLRSHVSVSRERTLCVASEEVDGVQPDRDDPHGLNQRGGRVGRAEGDAEAERNGEGGGRTDDPAHEPALSNSCQWDEALKARMGQSCS
jgi:hypothetical protein